MLVQQAVYPLSHLPRPSHLEMNLRGQGILQGALYCERVLGYPDVEMSWNDELYVNSKDKNKQQDQKWWESACWRGGRPDMQAGECRRRSQACWLCLYGQDSCSHVNARRQGKMIHLLWYWRLNSGSLACKANTITELNHLWSFYFIFFFWDKVSLHHTGWPEFILTRQVLNLWSSSLSFLSS